MSNDKAWTDEWLKAQQKFVESWSEMGKGRGKSEQNDQANLWANGLEMWRKTYPYPYQTQPETDQVINKCLEVGKGYFAMAEQIGKQMSGGRQTRGSYPAMARAVEIRLAATITTTGHPCNTRPVTTLSRNGWDLRQVGKKSRRR